MRPIAIAAVLFVLAPIAAAGSARNRAVGTVPSHGTIAVGPEYRIPANPDSPWLESVAVAAGPTSGIVVWTEDGPKSGEATIRFARLASDGHPLDAAGRLLIENGHYQRHVAIDAFGDQFVAAWCDVSDTTKKIVAMRLDASGRAIDAVPVVVADVASTSEPQVNVTCSNAGCFVTWGGNGSYGSFSVGVVTGAPIFSRSSRAAGAPLQLTPKGIGNGIGTDALNFCTAYAEEVAYGKSSALVAKVISADGSANEIPL
ncbi:MAG TPA: hypothetical protein VHY33_07860, partial [Thermoanaerobaculia bacterium]|nr:hypothetical protein [Thermoanaerobaculia bacterium]